MKRTSFIICAAALTVLFMFTVIGCDIRNTDDDDLADMQGELNLESISDNEVLISWSSNSDVKDYYLLERSTGSAAFETIAELPPSNTAFMDSALTINTLYRYRLSGINGDKQTNYLENTIELSFAALTDFYASAENIHTVHLVWIHSCDYESGYLLERRDGESGGYETVIELPANTLSFSDSTAYPGIALNYRLTAFSEYNESNSLESPCLLNFPSVEDLAVNQLDVNRFELTWDDMAEGEDGYVIERRIDNGANVIVGELAANSETFIDDISSRDEISSIAWWVKAVYQQWESNTEMVESVVDFPAPHIESIQQASLTSCRIIWTDNSEGETGFRIDRRDEDGFWEEATGYVDANETEWIDTTIEMYGEYFYRVFAVSSNNISPESNHYYYEQSFPPPDGLVYSIQSFGEIDLNWNDNSFGEDGFRLDRRFTGEDWQIAYQEFAPDTESFTDTDLTTGTTVSYRIYAFLGDLESTADYLYLIDVTVDPPQGLFYQQENIHSISLFWDDIIDGEEGYKIDRQVNGIWTEEYSVTEDNIESWLDEDVPVNTTVCYRVYAFSGEFNGDAAETSTINTEIAAPTGLAAVLNGVDNISLVWEDNIDGENGFVIDRYKEGEGWQVEYAGLPENAENWTDTAIEYGSQLKYRLYAFYGEENGLPVETDLIDVMLPAPENLVLERTGLTTLLLNWEDTITGEDNYIIDRQIDGSDWETEYAVLTAETESYTDENLVLQQQVRYRVYGRSAGYDGAALESDWVTLEFPAPQDFTVTFSAPSQLSFAWSYPWQGADGFVIESYTYAGGWTEFAGAIPGDAQNWTANGEEWGIYRITAYLSPNYEASSLGGGVAPEGFAAVAGSSFDMGDQFNEGDDDELPVHEVEISGLYVATMEVNQGDFYYQFGFNPSQNQGADLPVENMDWNYAVLYCNALSDDYGYTPCYTIEGDDVTCDWNADGFRLLTEAEWEYVARGGVYADDNYRYSGSNNLSQVSWNNSTSTHMCGTKEPNQLGIYDMSGNVWEMCWDFYDDGYYSESTYLDPIGPIEGFSRVTRGGGYNSDDDSCRVANRYHRDESYTNGNLGFRICRRK